MAKFCTPVIALLCLFTLSLARNSPEDGVTSQYSLHLPESSQSIPAIKGTDVNAAAVVISERFIRLTFRPINRRFPVRSKQPHRRDSEVHRPLARIKEIENGVIERYTKNGDSSIPELPRRIPSRSMKLHHHRQSDDEDGVGITRIKIENHNLDRFNKEKKLKVLRIVNKHFRNRNKVEDEEKKDGFMKRLHKFFGHSL